MPDLNPTTRRFITPRLFEILLLIAALLETAHLIGLFDRREEVDGTTLAVIFTLGVPWIVLLLGLAVTRIGSSVAKWALVLLTAIALISAVRVGIGRWAEPAILAGAVAGMLQTVSVALLFTPIGRSWTSGTA